MTPPAINGHIRTILVTVDAVGGVWRYALDLAAGLEDEDIKIILTGFGPPPTAEQILEIPRNCRLVWLAAPQPAVAGRRACCRKAGGGGVAFLHTDVVFRRAWNKAAARLGVA